MVTIVDSKVKNPRFITFLKSSPSVIKHLLGPSTEVFKLMYSLLGGSMIFNESHLVK